MTAGGRGTDELHLVHQPERRPEALLEDRDHLQEPVAQGLLPIDLLDPRDDVSGLEGPGDRRVDQVVLRVEGPEDRALGDPGGLGDVPGRHRPAVDAQQPQGHVGQLGPALLG